MPNTALEEHFGKLFTTSTSPTNLPLPSGVTGSARWIHNIAAGVLNLPDARLIPHGGLIFIIYNDQGGGGALTLRDSGGTTVATAFNHEVIHCYLLDNTSAEGTWLIESMGTAAVSSAHSLSIDEFTVELGAGENQNVNIRQLVNDQGYDGNNPALVHVFVGPQASQTSGVVGSQNTTGLPAMDSGSFPAGSKMILTVLPGGYITGRGGTGGGGQPIIGGTTGTPTYGSTSPAGNGGDALYLRVDTLLFNYGKIQGGGGGGSGGAAAGTTSGPGGGGGAGARFSDGGNDGNIPSGSTAWSRGGKGTEGRLDAPGLGGGNGNGAPAGLGGNGGAPGQNGEASSTGVTGFGQAGMAIRISIGSGATLTKVVAGTIDGSEGTIA